MATIIIKTASQILKFQHVTRIWNDSAKGNSIKGTELVTRGNIEITYDDGETVLIPAATVESITFHF